MASIRSALRAHTSDAHRRLDAAVGDFIDRSTYAAYVRNTYSFRQAIEARVRGTAAWQVDCIASRVALDLHDLGESVPSAALLNTSPALTEPECLGAAYVLEGSSLGARLLLRRAERLGFNASFGARHLARQAGDERRWQAFLAVIEAADAAQLPLILAGANFAFQCALEAYQEAQHEHA